LRISTERTNKSNGTHLKLMSLCNSKTISVRKLDFKIEFKFSVNLLFSLIHSLIFIQRFLLARSLCHDTSQLANIWKLLSGNTKEIALRELKIFYTCKNISQKKFSTSCTIKLFFVFLLSIILILLLLELHAKNCYNIN
jgi:hypothetical protein